tara:strand:+ start:1214 stop:2089 length:876 start_codon:yes stop_codon:yes gene_type:complete
MSKEKKLKWLHEFEVLKTEKEKITEKDKNAEGEDIEITKTVDKKVSIKFAIRKPNRRMYEDADLFYGIKLSDGIKQGLMTKTLLSKRFINDGGTMSEAEKDDYASAYEELTDSENKIQRLQINLEKLPEKEKSTKLREELKKALELRYSLQNIENEQSSLFDQTAENRAKNKTILWWVLYLSYMEKGDSFIPVFGEADSTYEEKIEKYDEYEDEDDLFWNESIRKLAYYISFWESGQVESEEDFKSVDNMFSSSASEEEEGVNEDKEEESVPKPVAKKKAKKKVSGSKQNS